MSLSPKGGLSFSSLGISATLMTYTSGTPVTPCTQPRMVLTLSNTFVAVEVSRVSEVFWLLVIGSPVVIVLLLLSQEVNGPTVKDLHKWSSGPPDLSRGPVLVSDPELQFGCGNLGN